MSNALAQLSAALAGRYDIDREIGRGGSATVYLARDVRHHRKVAIKVLDPDVGAALGVDRFLGEIRVTANLQHPNVLPLFDSGEAGGSLFYVMPFVDGESLRMRLEREGALAIDEAIRITTAVAHAIDYAHRRGVIHRDIKPENILFSDGVPVVADFGIAKALSSTRTAEPGQATAGLTQVGMSLGTPAYMSPEQAMGEPDIDGRSDVYALGCLLYEMLTGELPFTGPTAHAIIAKHIMTPVPSVRHAREAVSPVIDSAIARAMAKDAASRFPTPAEFAAALVVVPTMEPKPDYSQVVEPVTRSTEPIVGRRKELAELLPMLDAVENGSGGLVLVGGEPGVGKTRLTEAILLEARRRGFFCAVGHCYEMEGAPPYLPMVEQLEYAGRVVPHGRFRAALGDGAAEIARVAPSLRQLFPDIGSPVDLPVDQQRHYLFSRFREYMERSAANVPLVLLYDDLHWADESTLLLIEHLAQHAPRMRMLLLGTYRDVDLDVGRPFARTLERLSRQRLAERLMLRRMPESDVADLLASLGAPDPPANLVTAIFRETEGNPFFVEEVFHHLREEGRLLDSDGRWLANLEIGELDVPEGVRLVIGRRLERVGDACRAMLTAAAVIGPRFELRLLNALGDTDEDATLDALETAEAAGLIMAQPVGRETRYAFSHELIRHTLLAGLSLPRRQRRHQKTAEAIETVYGAHVEVKISDLAYHLFQAGAAVDTDRTTETLLRAARQTLHAGAFDEARTQADRALSILEPGSDERELELLQVRAAAWRGMGAWPEAVRDLEVVVPRLFATGQALAGAVATGDLTSMLTWAEGNHPTIIALLERAMAELPPEHSALRARLMARAGNSVAVATDFALGQRMLDEAVAMAEASGDAEAYAETVMVRGAHGYNFLLPHFTIEGLEHARLLATALDKRWDLALILSFLGRSYRVAGDHGRATELSLEASAISGAIGHVGGSVLAAIDLGNGEWMRNPSIPSLMESAVRLVGLKTTPALTEAAVWKLATARNEQDDDPDPARDLVGSEDRARVPQWRDIQWAARFIIDAYRQPARARDTIEWYAGRLPVAGVQAFGGMRAGLAMIIEGLATLGDDARAASLYEPMREVMASGGVVDYSGVFECAAGIAAACSARWDVADAHFVSALETALRIPHVPAQGEVRRWHAWMRRRRGAPGDLDHARRLLKEAIELNERYGLVFRTRLCREAKDSR